MTPQQLVALLARQQAANRASLLRNEQSNATIARAVKS
jgi:uncharacterized membrane protein affecting hemolysin expression